MRIATDDYEPLKAFFAWASAHILPGAELLPLERRPLANLEALERKSAAKARLGLGMAVGDIVEVTEGLSEQQLREIDAALAAEGLLTLSIVRARFLCKTRQIMERGLVKDEAEYHALRNVVDDLPDEDRKQGRRLLAAFEARAGGSAA